MLLALSAAFLLSFGCSWGLSRWLISAAPRWGLVDRPGGTHKGHAKATPLGGGVAIYLSVVLCFLVVVLGCGLVHLVPSVGTILPEAVSVHAAGVLARTPILLFLLTLATIQMAAGLTDDWRRDGLGWRVRLGLEVVLTLVLIWFGVRLTIHVDAWWLTIPLTILWIVGLTNAFNFLDNMDGLSGGVAACASGLLAAIAFFVQSWFILGGFLILLGALLGFLCFNWTPARIFMGDAGSNFVGFWIATLTIVATYHVEGFNHVTVLAPLCVLAVPIYDVTVVVCLRLLQGKSPFQPDRQHLSHRLVALGFKRPEAVLLIYLVTVTTGLGGVLLYFLRPGAGWLVVMQVVGILGVLAILEVVSYHRQLAEIQRNEAPKEQLAKDIPSDEVTP
ncbi:WecA-like glycosyltransferase [Planctomycetes bacterium Pan216]|uniref:WecA-like glycosyltransferase n=1 Tax=Kolteria novifilia TaxID=2527975 RepID=A0A518B5T4_9BACT|nr:WecA-like glycosyltransferase [Planctomycetes bacterium Pan216]